MRIASLTCYPVKSLGGHALDAGRAEARGLAGDRRWMVVDARHRFVTRREVPAMARLTAEPTPAGLLIRGPAGSVEAAVPDPYAPLVRATVWRDTVAVRLSNDAADAFLSSALGRPVRLAYQPDDSHRPVDPAHARPGEHVSLADGYPLLVTTTASLAALNARLAVPVPMARFRSNLVIDGAEGLVEAWAEDRWASLRVGEVELRLARPCTRCVVVTQQPDTGERLEGNEPLSTLRAMGRLMPGGVTFGWNAVATRPGRLAVGDAVEVLGTRA